MFKKLISLAQIQWKTYYPEYIISWFPYISHKEMRRIIKDNPLQDWYNYNSSCHIIINWQRVSIRRIKILIKLLPTIELYYWWNGRKLVAQDIGNYYDLREFLPNRNSVTINDVIIINK